MKSVLEKRREMLNRVSNNRRWFDMSNKDGDVAEIRIYDEIWFLGITAEDFASQLDEITAPKILVMLNSPGGDVFDGIAIYNALRSHSAEITTRVDGIAASIASVIAQAGDRRVMLSGSQMMIHEAWGLTIGSAKDMREYADLLDRQTDNIANVYARRADKDVADFRSLMEATTWMTAEEAVTNGLADEVVDPSEDAPSARIAKKTLHDEIAEATDVVTETIEKAQRVAALRAEKGKDLSQVNRDSLDELAQSMEQLQALLDETPEPAESGPVDTPDESEDVAREFARFVELSVAIP